MVLLRVRLLDRNASSSVRHACVRSQYDNARSDAEINVKKPGRRRDQVEATRGVHVSQSSNRRLALSTGLASKPPRRISSCYRSYAAAWLVGVTLSRVSTGTGCRSVLIPGQP